jgi:phage terminase small subunit
MPGPLKNQRHEHFAAAYAVSKNATQAAKEAGYSPKTAHAQGFRLLKYADVQARIQELIGESLQRLHMTRDEVLARVAMIGRADPRRLFAEDGTLKNPAELDDIGAATLAGFEIVEEFAGDGAERVPVGRTKKVRLRDPIPALRILAEHHKIIGADTAEGLNNLASALAERFNRARERKRSQ